MVARADIGMIGLAVMGQNLALNMADHGFTVAVFNRTASVTDQYATGPAAGKSIVPTHDLAELVAQLRPPRRVMLMVKADAVDTVISQLAPLLAPGDIIIDGGNSNYDETEHRVTTLEQAGLLFVGTGISGGEVGARYGPSIMPGGSSQAWPQIRKIFQAIAAKVADGTPCCDWVGPGGAGHYVKMVHNGIEYGDMEVIAEAYALMKAMGMAPAEMAAAFRTWDEGVLDSYLIEITARILDFVDTDGSPLLEKILDSAGQKGTGKWTVVSALEAGQPVTLVAEAVFARMVSSLVEERIMAAGRLPGPATAMEGVSVDDLQAALYGSKIVSYAQGFMLMAAASKEKGWNLDLARIASLWREGCIIRARFLDDITAAYRGDPQLINLLLDSFFTMEVATAGPGWRRVVAAAALSGVAIPAYASALAFYDGYRTERLPANLIQAQRDFFGAHTYERVDAPRGTFFHTDWTGSGGDVTAGTYQA